MRDVINLLYTACSDSNVDSSKDSIDEALKNVAAEVNVPHPPLSPETYAKLDTLVSTVCFSAHQWTLERQTRFFSVMLSVLHSPSFIPSDAFAYLHPEEFVQPPIMLLAESNILPPAASLAATMQPVAPPNMRLVQQLRDSVVKYLHRCYALVLPWRAFMRTILRQIFEICAHQINSRRPAGMSGTLARAVTSAIPHHHSPPAEVAIPVC